MMESIGFQKDDQVGKVLKECGMGSAECGMKLQFVFT
jgi:hypothetical protein